MARSGRRGPRRSNAFIGLIGALLVVVIMYFGFTKDIPFTHGYLLKAQFQSTNSIRPTKTRSVRSDGFSRPPASGAR